jgi:hypothetical protein
MPSFTPRDEPSYIMGWMLDFGCWILLSFEHCFLSLHHFVRYYMAQRAFILKYLEKQPIIQHRTWTHFQTRSGLRNAVESYGVLTLSQCRTMTNKSDVVKQKTIASVSMRLVTLICETPSCYWRIRSYSPCTGNTLLRHPPYAVSASNERRVDMEIIIGCISKRHMVKPYGWEKMIISRSCPRWNAFVLSSATYVLNKPQNLKT